MAVFIDLWPCLLDTIEDLCTQIRQVHAVYGWIWSNFPLNEVSQLWMLTRFWISLYSFSLICPHFVRLESIKICIFAGGARLAGQHSGLKIAKHAKNKFTCCDFRVFYSIVEDSKCRFDRWKLKFQKRPIISNSSGLA